MMRFSLFSEDEMYMDSHLHLIPTTHIFSVLRLRCPAVQFKHIKQYTQNYIE